MSTLPSMEVLLYRKKGAPKRSIKTINYLKKIPIETKEYLTKNTFFFTKLI
jgi:hypothetical protein